MDRRSRREKLKKRMAEAGLPALLITGKENRVYLSGFHSTDYTLLITEQEDYLFTDFRYENAALAECTDFQLVLLDRERTLAKALGEKAWFRLGVEEKNITASLYKELAGALAGRTELASGDGLVEALRTVKEPAELAAIERAEALGDRCFTHMLEYLRPGITEWEAAFEIEFFLRKNGASALSFDTICVSGERTALPHGMPTDKTLEQGDLVTLDFGCIVDDYCSDMTRTVALGKVSEFQREIYQVVLEAQLAGCRALKPGLSCAHGDRAARTIIEEAGYGDYFGHGLGHGVGLAIHEAPTLNPGSEEILGKDMVVTIEPGVYLPGKFGIRIEDLAFVSDSGIIIKANSPKELEVIDYGIRRRF